MQHNFTTSPNPNDSYPNDPRHTNHPDHGYTINLWVRTNRKPQLSHLSLLLHSIALNNNWYFGVNYCSKLSVDRNSLSSSSSLHREMAIHSLASTLHEIWDNEDRNELLCYLRVLLSHLNYCMLHLSKPISRLRSQREKTEEQRNHLGSCTLGTRLLSLQC